MGTELATSNVQGTEMAYRQSPIYPLEELRRMAKEVYLSGFFSGAKSEQAAFALMWLCQSEGIDPIQAMKRYHIIDGMPSKRADAMHAEFRNKGGMIYWVKNGENGECIGRFVHPKYAPEPGQIFSLSMEQLAERGLMKEMNVKYPGDMLRARVISKGVRAIYPEIVVGIYTPEETQEFSRSDPAPKVYKSTRAALSSPSDDAEVVDITPNPIPNGLATASQLTSIGNFLAIRNITDDKLATLLSGIGAESYAALTVHQADSLIAFVDKFEKLHTLFAKIGASPELIRNTLKKRGITSLESASVAQMDELIGVIQAKISGNPPVVPKIETASATAVVEAKASEPTPGSVAIKMVTDIPMPDGPIGLEQVQEIQSLLKECRFKDPAKVIRTILDKYKASTIETLSIVDAGELARNLREKLDLKKGVSNPASQIAGLQANGTPDEAPKSIEKTAAEFQATPLTVGAPSFVEAAKEISGVPGDDPEDFEFSPVESPPMSKAEQKRREKAGNAELEPVAVPKKS